jgi:hypothetical protein
MVLLHFGYDRYFGKILDTIPQIRRRRIPHSCKTQLSESHLAAIPLFSTRLALSDTALYPKQKLRLDHNSNLPAEREKVNDVVARKVPLCKVGFRGI